MTRRLMYEDVKEFIELNSECILLSKEYKNNSSNLILKCKCGNIFERSFDTFKRQKEDMRLCPKCSIAKKAKSSTFSFKEVKDFINDNSSCTLLSNSYEHNSKKLIFKCSCGNIFKASFFSFKYDNKRCCNECSKKKIKEKKSFGYSYIKKFVNDNSNCELLSNECDTTDSDLILKCKCGIVFKTKFSAFKYRNKRQCNNCSKKIISDKQSFDLEHIKKFIQENSNAILLSKEYRNQRTLLKFKCECGEIFQTNFDDFKNKNKRRCDICSRKKSYPEVYISSFLNKYNIEYKEQFKFKDCRYKDLLKFDFYIPKKNLIIEYDGEYHYKDTNFNKGFEEQKKRDRVKDKYCKEKNIKLIRVPYWKFKNIDEILIKELNL